MAALTERDFEIQIGNLLRAGVILSAAVVLLGGICYLAQHGRAFPGYHVFRGEPAAYSRLSGIATAAIQGDCLAVIQLGLLLLIATPIARVAFSLFAFMRLRYGAYMMVTLIVLVILVYSLTANH